MGNEGLEGLEARVDALHAPALVAVGNLPPNPPLLVPLRLGRQRDVGKAARERTGLDSGQMSSTLYPQKGPVLTVHRQRALVTCVPSLIQTVLCPEDTQS